MNTAELKIDLISQIAGITDELRLKEILQLLNFQSDKSIYSTTDEEKKAIAEAREQIANGEVSTHDEVQKGIKEWINK